MQSELAYTKTAPMPNEGLGHPVRQPRCPTVCVGGEDERLTAHRAAATVCRSTIMIDKPLHACVVDRDPVSAMGLRGTQHWSDCPVDIGATEPDRGMRKVDIRPPQATGKSQRCVSNPPGQHQ